MAFCLSFILSMPFIQSLLNDITHKNLNIEKTSFFVHAVEDVAVRIVHLPISKKSSYGLIDGM